jgi:hypothetical protein
VAWYVSSPQHEILWKFRKMGTLETGRQRSLIPSSTTLPSFFVVGWFLYWVGMVATDTIPGLGRNKTQQPSHFISIWIGDCHGRRLWYGTIVMFLDYAHDDEGAEFTGWRYRWPLLWTFLGLPHQKHHSPGSCLGSRSLLNLNDSRVFWYYWRNCASGMFGGRYGDEKKTK